MFSSIVVRRAGSVREDHEIVVEGSSRLEVYWKVKSLREDDAGTSPILVVRSVSADGLARDLAKIRWLSHAYRDLGCRVKYCLPISNKTSLETAVIGALGAGAGLIEIEVPPTKRKSSKSHPPARLMRELRARVENLAPVRSPEEAFTAVSCGKKPHREGQRVGVLICARTASSRLPGKALIPICGREAIALLIERMKSCRTCQEVVLCTTSNSEDDTLAGIAEREKIGLYRGPDENVALRMWGAAREFELDPIVRVTGDNLLSCVELIDRAVNSHQDQGADYTHTAGVFSGGGSEVISVKALEAIAERAVRSENTEYLAWYLKNSTVFRVHTLRVKAAYRREFRLTLDTPEDLKVIRAIYENLYAPGKPVDALQALDWLDKQGDIARINRGVRPKFRPSDLNLDMYL